MSRKQRWYDSDWFFHFSIGIAPILLFLTFVGCVLWFALKLDELPPPIGFGE